MLYLHPFNVIVCHNCWLIHGVLVNLDGVVINLFQFNLISISPKKEIEEQVQVEVGTSLCLNLNKYAEQRYINYQVKILTMNGGTEKS